MIDLAISPDALPRETVLQVVSETFDAIVDLTDAPPPEMAPLDDSFVLARAAHERGNIIELDEHLAKLASGAILGRAQLRVEFPDLGDA